LAFEHQYPALAVVRVRSAATESGKPGQDSHRRLMQERLLPGSDVAICVALKPESLPDPMHQDHPGAPKMEQESTLLLWFLDRPPSSDWLQLLDTYESLLAEEGVGDLEWASTFSPLIVGTDTYLDDLWLD
jgi:hypothetical protein